jgi:ribonuclease T1
VRWPAALWALLLFAGSALSGEIRVSELPREARATLQLIERGGPYPHPQDGHTFHNRERLLPMRGAGYYAEFTVQTPGARGRGARRIVAGRGGELYYTADHYRSFRRIMRE